ncbi:biopolymer transporter ExbD [Geitlerinema sp. PCC 9228]|jgi:biopolymer transport protein ExbD|uniref:ExbD/TolR family protein n=1 Tax=Geitlerinema sp. PCC 9228 TaxID=111611 RepID=UPI0008F9A6C9|nr:biopolymer transporter ExbD [Geitlerinema sp. PCC 9228]
MRLNEEPDRPAGINIVPAIDIIFSILAFFVISTLFLTRSEGLPVNLPEASTGESQSSSEIYITIAADGTLSVNKTSVEMEQLLPTVRKEIESGTKKLAIVNADEQVAHGRVVRVMDRLRRVDGLQLAIATESESEE